MREMLENMQSVEVLREKLAIEILSLDEEARSYPQMYEMVADHAVTAKAQAKTQKNNLERLYSELYLRYYAKFENETGKKPTEKYLNSMILIDPKYMEVQDELVLVELEAEEYKNIEKAMAGKCNMLELLGKLYLSEHFSDVAIKGFRERMQKLELEVAKKKVEKLYSEGEDDE